jgi:hypothetical protein
MTALDTWEKRLTPYFTTKLRLIAEIPLVYEDVQAMGEAIKECLQHNPITHATSILTTHYPLTFITYMSGFAAYNTEQNFWQAFSDSLCVDKQALYNQKWHRSFVQLAKNRGLKAFGFSEDPTPYVTSIRFQGGIPTYSLPDYFEKMVLPALQRSALRELPAKDALAYLLEHTYFVDSPVFDFLRNSGDLGVEFFASSCKLAKHALEHHGEIISA